MIDLEWEAAKEKVKAENARRAAMTPAEREEMAIRLKSFWERQIAETCPPVVVP